MNRKWLTGLVTGITFALLGIVLTNHLNAQSGATPLTGRLACVDVIHTFNEFQMQKDLSEEMAEIQKKLEDENAERLRKMDALQAEIDSMSPDEPTLVDRVRELRAMTVDYKNWREIKQGDLTTEVGRWSIRVYEEIRKTVQEVATQNGYDMVFYRGDFETISMDPEVIKEQIRGIKLLYANPGTDITAVVVEKLNADYRANPPSKMMYVP